MHKHTKTPNNNATTNKRKHNYSKNKKKGARTGEVRKNEKNSKSDRIHACGDILRIEFRCVRTNGRKGTQRLHKRRLRTVRIP